MLQTQDRVNFETTAAFQPAMTGKGQVLRKLFMFMFTASIAFSILLSTGTTASADVPFVPLEERNHECPGDDKYDDWADTLEDIANRAEAAHDAGDGALSGQICEEYKDFLAEIAEERKAADIEITECKNAFVEYEQCQIEIQEAIIQGIESELESSMSKLEDLTTQLDCQKNTIASREGF